MPPFNASIRSLSLQRIVSAAAALALAVGGVAALLLFVNRLLRPSDFASVSLPVVAVVAAVASTFNPCGLPVLPGFFTAFASGGRPEGARRRIELGLGAGLGAVGVVFAVGILVSLAGAGTKGVISPYFRWVQLAVGLLLVVIALAHLADRTSRLPLVGRIVGVGGRLWDHAMSGRMTFRRSVVFGAGFVATGVG